ncbi:hypothetical protein KP509_22G003300 [Ceratopteris richardii]|uniref:Uncharacterized protein n=1 Tax=Ceratopteris richardii TaxID=49495 RepID=A0A8T2S4U1_CERRI|nr:hypothetical protein KP509_22G003300 [Ceratopteris richardii]
MKGTIFLQIARYSYKVQRLRVRSVMIDSSRASWSAEMPFCSELNAGTMACRALSETYDTHSGRFYEGQLCCRHRKDAHKRVSVQFHGVFGGHYFMKSMACCSYASPL